MAPEQILGVEVDARADQFSFCVALYEALYGKRPFEGRNINELVEKQIAHDPEPPDSDEVPQPILEAILQGLASDPEQRYPTMKALLADLQLEPVVLKRRWVTVALMALLLLAIGAGFATFFHRC